MNADRYKRLTRNNQTSSFPKIITYVPKPTEDDYSRRSIRRYFVQKANDNNAPIYEVEASVFSSLSQNPTLKSVSLLWKIKGDEVKTADANSKSLKLASDRIKNIRLYLPNLLQFHQP
jgi:hypothetical protein